MQWLKFSLLIIFASLSSFVFASKFSSQECLNSKYNTMTEHKGKFFGLIENKLKINKEVCHIDVMFKGILETTWKIDVCREPIHMKVTSKGSQDVYKRNKKCGKGIKSDYCYYRNELINSLQDHGLIFAKGQREDIEQNHGQVYCAYLLLKRYLDDGIIFSIYDSPKNIYNEQKGCSVPSKSDKQSNKQPSSNEEESVVNTYQPTEKSTRGMRPLTKEESEEISEDMNQPKF